MYDLRIPRQNNVCVLSLQCVLRHFMILRYFMFIRTGKASEGVRSLASYAKPLHRNAEICMDHELLTTLVSYGHVLNIPCSAARPVAWQDVASRSATRQLIRTRGARFFSARSDHREEVQEISKLVLKLFASSVPVVWKGSEATSNQNEPCLEMRA